MKILEGNEFKSRTGAIYIIGLVTPKNFQIIKESGKMESISFKKVESTKKRLLDGEKLNFQQNAPKGGISYTVAIESGVVFALSNIIKTDLENRVFILNKEVK